MTVPLVPGSLARRLVSKAAEALDPPAPPAPAAPPPAEPPAAAPPTPTLPTLALPTPALPAPVLLTQAAPAPAAPPPGLPPEGHATQRHDGITPERQRLFIEVLAATGSVVEAARQAGASRQAFYAFRNRDAGRDFSGAWDHALDLATQALCDVAYERALNGVEEPVFYHGEQVGTRRRYNDRLLMMLLRVRAGTDYATLAERRGWQTVTAAPATSFEGRVARLGRRRRTRA